MALAEPGDAIIVPPASIGGHVTHHQTGAAGLYGLEIHEAPIDRDRYTIDPERPDHDRATQHRPLDLTQIEAGSGVEVIEILIDHQLFHLVVCCHVDLEAPFPQPLWIR